MNTLLIKFLNIREFEDFKLSNRLLIFYTYIFRYSNPK